MIRDLPLMVHIKYQDAMFVRKVLEEKFSPASRLPDRHSTFFNLISHIYYCKSMTDKNLRYTCIVIHKIQGCNVNMQVAFFAIHVLQLGQKPKCPYFDKQKVDVSQVLNQILRYDPTLVQHAPDFLISGFHYWNLGKKNHKRFLNLQYQLCTFCAERKYELKQQIYALSKPMQISECRLCRGNICFKKMLKLFSCDDLTYHVFGRSQISHSVEEIGYLYWIGISFSWDKILSKYQSYRASWGKYKIREHMWLHLSF